MQVLKSTITEIKAPDKAKYKEALKRLSLQARPAGSLGVLENISARLASIAGTLDVKLKNKVIVVCAGDHGIVEEGVSLFPQEVTSQMVFNFVKGGASINVLARHAGAKVLVADFGVNYDFARSLMIFDKKVRKATSNFTKGPAMTREEAVRSVEGGISIVEELLMKGRIDLLGTGDMGIGNTTPSSAVIAVLSGVSVEEVTGRGTGLDDKALQNKIKVIKNGIKINKPNKKDALDVLRKVGGFEIGGLAGLLLGAAAHKIPVVCDGLISTAGALIACELAPLAKEYLFTSHRSVEAGHKYMHGHLGLEPLLDLKLRLGEGTGAALAMELLDAATRVLAEIKTFSEVNIADVQRHS
ncbi:MAG: nicotinate-nucleotide--dimethylbenzimidazole phosphoribosyltransferase [Spirochaetota bacterium]